MAVAANPVDNSPAAAAEGRAFRAVYKPQGTCPKPWVAEVGGKVLCDSRDDWRRFSTEDSAYRAAKTGAAQ